MKFKAGLKKTPKNLTAGVSSVEETLLMILIFSAHVWPSLLLLQKIFTSLPMLVLEKKTKLVLSWWRTKRFVRKNSQTLRNSRFTISVKTFMSSCERRRSVVSSANNRVTKIRSETYNIRQLTNKRTVYLKMKNRPLQLYSW